MTTLKIYADRMSQPARAILLFCKLNGIEFQEIRADLSKAQHLTPHYREIHPFNKIPAIVHGEFKHFESHAILIYLACAFPGVADHWYPADLIKRAKIHSVLDWYHLNIRLGAARYVLETVLNPALGQPLDAKAAAQSKKLLSASLTKMETFWLKGDGPFLVGSFQPSIADLSFVCEIMQLEVLDDKDRDEILGPHKIVLKWVEDMKNATRPHFDDVHSILFRAKERLKKERYAQAVAAQGSVKKPLQAKM